MRGGSVDVLVYNDSEADAALKTGRKCPCKERPQKLLKELFTNPIPVVG